MSEVEIGSEIHNTPNNSASSLSPQNDDSQSGSTLDPLGPNRRNLIDEDVLTWVTQTQAEGKVITPNLIRQKAYEIGRQYDPYFKASINWYNKWKKKFNYEESPEADALKHKKRAYTAAFKLYAVQRANELLSVSQASLELNVSRRCLQRWKEEIDVISKVAERASNAVYRRPGQGRKVSDANLDSRLLEWLEKAWRNGEQVTSAVIRQKARELSSNQDFKASLGWFVKWQKRHNIDLKEHTMDSHLKKKGSAEAGPLKLRLLPEGQEVTYSDRSGLSRKRKRDFEATVGHGDEEFDRLLLTWLVERWEAGIIVNEKMLRDRATELNTNQDFRPTKTWITEWKNKYNVSLENQTYGTVGESEGEIVEESQVYDEVTLHDSPLTPTKEEAATALASLASEDPSMAAGGIEIAQALQKLASAFGLTQEVSKDTLAQQLQLTVSQVSPVALSNNNSLSVLSSAVSASTPYLLESGEVQVGAEEVVSEEVVTDEPVVVLESTGEHVDFSKDVVGSIQTLSSSSACSLHEREGIYSSSSSSPLVTGLPLSKISALELAVPNTLSLDSSGGHFSDVNLLTTLANSHFVTETSSSGNSSHIPLITSAVEQLIQTSLSATVPGSDLAVTTSNIADQILVPKSSTDKITIDQGDVIEVGGIHVNESADVAVESEVVIGEPMILNIVSEGGVNLEEEVVTLLLENGGTVKQEGEQQSEFGDILLEDDDGHGGVH